MSQQEENNLGVTRDLASKHLCIFSGTEPFVYLLNWETLLNRYQQGNK